LEQLDFTGREAIAVWDGLKFHNAPFSPGSHYSGPTQPFESNYTRDKAWLRRRFELFQSPFADFGQAASEEWASPMPKPRSVEEWGSGLKRLWGQLYFPDI
jgi:hypothetical protein